MKSVLAILALCLAAEPAGAAPDGPIAVFAPYAGSWACAEHTDGQPDRVSLFRFALDPALLRETIFVPKSKLLPRSDVINATFAFDARNHRYVETEMGGDAVWYVSAAPAPTDGVFRWTDIAAATQLSHWNMTLPEHGAFTIEAYNKPADKTPNYRAAFKREPGRI
jgi:hypothetical protein